MDKRLVHQIGKVFCFACLLNVPAFVSAFAEGVPSGENEVANEIAYNPKTGVYEQKAYEPQYSRRSSYKSKPNIEINANITFSTLDYNVVTATNSVLKWRDSVGLGGDISIAKVMDSGNKLIAAYKGTSLSGGTMSDYDMANIYPVAGVFSETEKMTGSFSSYSLAYEKTNASQNFIDVSWLFGYEYRNLQLNPSGVYQVVYDPTNVAGGSLVGYDSGESQNVKVSMQGFKFGSAYKIKTSQTSNLTLSTEAFLPIAFESKYYNWGYGNSNGWDMRISLKGLAGYGLSGKIQHQIDISSKASWNIYTFAEITSIASSAIAIRQVDVTYSNGKSNDIKLYRFGLGTGLMLR